LHAVAQAELLFVKIAEADFNSCPRRVSGSGSRIDHDA
jgi:hypothetical protein